MISSRTQGSRQFLNEGFAAGAALAVLFGAAAFGAVHSWALRVLEITAAVLGCLGFVVGSARPRRLLIAAACLTILGFATDLVPVPNAVAEAVGARDTFLQRYDVSYSADSTHWRSLSISPHETTNAIVAIACMWIWCIGVSVGASGVGVRRRLQQYIALVGTAVAVFGLIQKALFNGKIYWMWESTQGASGNYFGPFVNRNHFAGWMVLAMAVTLGYLCGALEEVRPGKAVGIRNRLLWCGSREAAVIGLQAAAAVAMMVSIVFTMSRSGMAAAVTAMLVIGYASFRRYRRRIMTVSVMIVLVLAVSGAAYLKGPQLIARWYENTITLGWRINLWRDSMPPLKDFWPVGSGANTYGLLMLIYHETDTSVHAQQAHNDYLQALIELGLWGTACLMIAALLLVIEQHRVRGARQTARVWWCRTAALAGIIGLAVQEIVDFSLQIPGVALLFFLCLAFVEIPITARDRSMKRMSGSLDEREALQLLERRY